MALYTQNLPRWKKEEVDEIKRGIEEHTLVGLVDMYGIPASQVQQIRRSLRGTAKVRMARNTLIEHALNDVGGSVEALKEYTAGHSALIFTNENPFKLYKLLEKTKTKMTAKPGEIAPEDIVVPKGPTSFRPGPIVGELQQAGIPAAIEGGKVKIRETRTIVKKGEPISKKVADVLAKLGIKPMDVGLVLQAAYYRDTIFTPDLLAIDEEAYYNNIMLAAQQAFNLSVNAVIPTRLTISAIIGKAVREARNVGVEASIYEKDIIDLIIGRAQREMLAVALVAADHGFELDEAILKAAAAGTAAAPATTEPAEDVKAEEEEKEEEEKKEEDEESGLAGLGALFG
ncbi:MAG TPA: 50S ribosomal protein L10 [Candidatus Methanoculleus thermohydrogenotrophicum]|jgi:large subunit ribosomal protein L10|nr:50S ribosomal protein L10 [Candidatus Methanoculleus thermohydrogenotrophicum]NLM81610.1 50S ribosomal protein L10 [Candidatus Methanoculleus thermohydrogenotrophicum]HOB17115.1 50S ribosomal protein L10 [Candidatus Methanoculleus thermohydrogenotrophicum]HPZ37195.1 50S ribosomal protein L10 [Candidatus Methanoculleus thermohydrogenotrophicum]HQC90590.1 50S ribosomal protein L10 [Candidatus Methanoculleus thermohydrogenotrophicum]